MNEVINSKREKYLDIIKGIAILMVVNVHMPDNLSLFKGITFHLTAFFFVAGILIKKKQEENLPFTQIIKKKLKSIAWPYFTLSIIYIIITAIMKRQISIQQIYVTFSLLGLGTLWFFPALFLGEITFIGILKLTKKWINVIMPVFLVIILLTSSFLTTKGIIGKPCLNKEDMPIGIFYNLVIVIMEGLIATGYIGVGYLIQTIIDKTNCLKFNKIWYFIIGTILLIISYFISFKMVGNMHYAEIYTPLYYLIGTLCGTIAIFNISYSIENIEIVNKTLGWLGINSIIIMTTHAEYKILNLAYKIIGYTPIDNVILKEVLMLTSVILAEIIVINVVNKTKLKYIYKFPNELFKKEKMLQGD